MSVSSEPRAARAHPPAEAEPLIRAAGLSKRYRQGRTPVDALCGVDVAIPEGQFVGIVGRSGSGKSTLLHLLAALDRPTEGAIRVGAWDLETLSRKEQARFRREMVGMIFQQFNLVPTMTALDNVALPMVLAGRSPKRRRARAGECLERVGLADRADHRPAELSGGEQQRVAIARALSQNPPLLLADEPTGNLDSETGAEIIGLLRELQQTQGRTVVVVTHHFDEIADVAEQTIRLKDGLLREQVTGVG